MAMEIVFGVLILLNLSWILLKLDKIIKLMEKK